MFTLSSCLFANVRKVTEGGANAVSSPALACRGYSAGCPWRSPSFSRQRAWARPKPPPPPALPNGATQSCTVTFSASGAPETWTVPAGVTSATFDLYGAQGGKGSYGGLGGRVTATLAVTPGASYQVRVGVWGDSTGIPAGESVAETRREEALA